MTKHKGCNKEKVLLIAEFERISKQLNSSIIERVGNYTLKSLIGQGSFGKCYLAHHVLSGYNVVAKCIPKSDKIDYIARETYFHRQLRHENIIELFEVIFTELNVWLIMEYCPNGELYRNLGSLNLSSSQAVFAQICSAVAYIHSKGLVHRDIKLENIFFDINGMAKLGDFGLIREFVSESGNLTPCGTLLYTAPELLAIDCSNLCNFPTTSGEKADIWSLGVLLYTLLVGREPFNLEDCVNLDIDNDEARSKIIENILSLNIEYPENMQPQAKDLISSMLQKAPKNRISFEKIFQHPFLPESIRNQYNADQYILKDHTQDNLKLKLRVIKKMIKAGIPSDDLYESIQKQLYDPIYGWYCILLKHEKNGSPQFKPMETLHESKNSSSSVLSPCRSHLSEGQTRYQLQSTTIPRYHKTMSNIRLWLSKIQLRTNLQTHSAYDAGAKEDIHENRLQRSETSFPPSNHKIEHSFRLSNTNLSINSNTSSSCSRPVSTISDTTSTSKSSSRRALKGKYKATKPKFNISSFVDSIESKSDEKSQNMTKYNATTAKFQYHPRVKPDLFKSPRLSRKKVLEDTIEESE